MSVAAMELVNLKKSIGNKNIIKGLSFSINRGEVFGFIGPNGAGKTTTIRMMVGLINISEGDVLIQGHSIQQDFKKAVREVGAIVENPEMYPFMTGWQNLKHYARMVPGVTKERIHEVVKLIGMEKAINEKVGRYSLGMRQRLGIAQALLHKPSVLILDEPTNGLDPAGIREMRGHIRHLAQEENVAVIVSSHLLSEIEQMCDRIGVIKNGEMVTLQQVGAQDNGNLVHHMTVAPTNKAKQLLEEKFALKVVELEGDLSFRCEKEQMPAIIKSLVENNCAVYQANVVNGTLEDQFFELIGENTIE
ncbi:putative ABC transporter ATP-binding protein YhcH [Virgibacillus pantothenticus]|uniref:Bacitracin ABC transporter ATP-binding protein n=1 Tax=Virgibacillus pantothenticus TaxID=1473 RepID=A0A0L0QS25_VIRPA|nr:MULTISPECIES: ABC transporter ATP-binding protein [Virgibacillus]API92003.1 bacitracin ABC transporter ATP-binding protein [Virgibacillus sp. 6R]KNE21366.1 bacitracin ABC transporter ATP-binding protein [Virgibacillus pantothenticus]MBS7430462.1 ABC transporter ATP-binding protein [Virgibacillus sp. 19R1-5]MBU8566400.1 ABC transporter ATP-binding protein [Virgibacillus pantothenticus]MBU8600184.1 ABC transporter ATP-binding protein [Virgibacillus pantothenticus]